MENFVTNLLFSGIEANAKDITKLSKQVLRIDNNLTKFGLVVTLNAISLVFLNKEAKKNSKKIKSLELQVKNLQRQVDEKEEDDLSFLN